MKNKYLFVIVVILSIIAIISSHKTAFLNDVTVKIKDVANDTIEEIELEEYVLGVVAGEMPASFNEEALKAQAVAARSFALYKINHSNKDYDLKSDKSSQVYITKADMHGNWQDKYEYYYKKVKTAVLATKGEILTYDSEVIPAYYFAMSNGMTENVAFVFGGQEDYLVSVDSSWDQNVKNFEVAKTMSMDEFKNKLGIDDNIIKITNIIRTDSNRVEKININGHDYAGTEVRKILNLRSTDFDIKIGDEVTIVTKGYGHGVGMSQYGAQELAKKGYNYKDILKHYYQNTIISNIYV